jgi:hypothetical protein
MLCEAVNPREALEELLQRARAILELERTRPRERITDVPRLCRDWNTEASYHYFDMNEHLANLRAQTPRDTTLDALYTDFQAVSVDMFQLRMAYNGR